MIVDVTELNLKTLNFKKEYEAVKIKRAKLIYDNKDVIVTNVEKIDEENYIISAKVNGSYMQKYNVTLSICKDYINEYSCKCDDYNNGCICKHILATSMEAIEPHNHSIKENIEDEELYEIEKSKRLYMLRIKEERKKREYRIKYSEVLEIIDKFKKRKEINNYIDLNDIYKEIKTDKRYLQELSTQIRLEPIIEISKNQELYLNFKIGQTNMYPLENIKEFYEAFSNNDIITYGRNLNFVCKKENFTDESQKFLKFILDYGQIIKYNEKIYEKYYYKVAHSANHSIYLVDDKIDEFFRIMKYVPIMILNSKGEQKEYRITNEDINIMLDVKKCDNEYEIKINLEDYDYIISNKNIYIFYNSEIYIFNKKQNENLGSILEMFRTNKNLLVPKDKIKEFGSYVFSEIMEYIQTEDELIENIRKEIIRNKPVSKINLDLDGEDNIKLELRFCYLDYEFNILDNNHKRYVKENNIMRNTKEEEKILKRLFLDGFEISERQKYFILRDEILINEFLSSKIVAYVNDFESVVTDKLVDSIEKKERVS